MDVLRIAPLLLLALFAWVSPMTAYGSEAEEVMETERAAIEASVNVAEELDDEQLRAVISQAQEEDGRMANAGRVDRRPAILAPPSEELAADDDSESARYLRSLESVD